MGGLTGVKTATHPLKAAIGYLRTFLAEVKTLQDRYPSTVCHLPIDEAGRKALTRLLDLADHGRNRGQRAKALARKLRVLGQYQGKDAAKLGKLLSVSQSTSQSLEIALDHRDAAIARQDGELARMRIDLAFWRDEAKRKDELLAKTESRIALLTGDDEVTKS